MNEYRVVVRLASELADLNLISTTWVAGQDDALEELTSELSESLGVDGSIKMRTESGMFVVPARSVAYVIVETRESG